MGWVLGSVNGDIGLFRPIYCFNPDWLAFLTHGTDGNVLEFTTC